jgi:Tfp pilus assembly protein FimT
LLELMLVLAILLVLAGLAWPRVEGMYERHRLQKAAEDVRLHLAGCRLRALEAGVIYQFRYQPGGQTYDVAPLLTDSTAGTDTAVLTATLPEAMTFELTAGTIAAGTTATGSVGMAGSVSMTGMTTSSVALAGGTSAVPILFLPDGTADETTLDVVDDQGRRVRLSVRGLTSAVTLKYEGKEGRL